MTKKFLVVETTVDDEVTMSWVFTEGGFFVVHLQIFISNITIIREIVIT